jgi:DNA-binding NarL/FixJ family response regulator
MIRVLIAEDEPLVRAGIAMLLSVEDDITVVAEAATGEDAVALARTCGVDVVVLDLRMPGTGGVEATRQLTRDRDDAPDRPVRVLILTTFDDEATVEEALLAGADGFMIKLYATRHLPDAIREVAAGHHWLDPSIAGQVLRSLRSRRPPDAPESRSAVQTLTPREREVLALMARGLTNDDICRALVLSLATVRTHVTRILMKTGSHDRAQAVAVAYRSGFADGRWSGP